MVLSDNASWLDRVIEEQRVNTDIMKEICSPFDPAELQEMAEYEGWV